MSQKTFLLQEKLEALVAEKKARVSGKELTMFDSNARFTIVPAVKFVRCETSEHDPHGLTGKFAQYDKLNAEGAEIFLSSVIYKEQSYKIEQGYICSLSKN